MHILSPFFPLPKDNTACIIELELSFSPPSSEFTQMLEQSYINFANLIEIICLRLVLKKGPLRLKSRKAILHLGISSEIRIFSLMNTCRSV